MRNKGVCFQPDRLRLPLLLWQLCLFHGPHYEPFCLSFLPAPHPRSPPHIFFFSPSLYPCDWAWSLTATPFSLQVHLLPWLAGNYQPGDSSPFQELRGHQGVFFGAQSFPGPPEVLRAGFSLWGSARWWQCRVVSSVFMCVALSALLPSTFSLAIFDPVTERRAREGACFSVVTTVITAGRVSNCSDSRACEVL